MIWELIAIIIVALVIILLFLVIRNIVILILNSIIGLFALIGFNYLFNSDIAINFWSVLITAIGGVLGFLAVVVLHYLGIAF